MFAATSTHPCRLLSSVEMGNSILFEPCRSKWLFSSRNQATREDKALQEGELPPKHVERAEGAMRALIRIFLLLDFALVCLFAS